VSRVICYSPLHHMSLAQMSEADIRQVIEAWTSEYQTLSAMPQISAVTIFENRGPMMGASSPHPHGQIWANETIPNELQRESAHQLQYLAGRGSCLLCDY
jgi:UDPglucose--hexose-1-phosphate uridylyltransferase